MLYLCKKLKLNVLPLIIMFFLLNENVLSQTLIDLEEALRTAKMNNLQIRKQQESQKAARLEEQVRKAQKLPTIDFTISTNYFSEVNEIDLSQTIGIPGKRVALGGHDRSELMLGIRQPVFTGFRLQSQVDLAKNARLGEEAKFELVVQETFHQIYLLFYQAQSLYNQKRILAASLKRLKFQLENVRNLFAAEQAMAFDTLQVYNQILAIKIEQQKNDLNMNLTNLQLARLLDLPQPRPLVEMELKRPAGPPGDLAQLKQAALTNRPELKNIQVAQNGFLIQQKLTRASYFPVIFAQANYHYAKPGLDPVSNAWMDYYSVGVNMQWNLWRWQGDQKKIEEIKVLHNRLQLEERELLRAVDYQVEQSYEELKFSLNEWRLSEELQAQQAERYRIVSVQHQNDIASTNDLITAEADLTRSELQTQQALIRYYINVAHLKKAVGTIGEKVE